MTLAPVVSISDTTTSAATKAADGTQVTRHDSLYLTLVSNFAMRRSDYLDRLVPAMASAFLSGQCCLQLFQFLLCLVVVTRIVEKIASEECGKMGHYGVNHS